MLKWAFSVQGEAGASTSNDDQVEAIEENQVPDIEKPWDPSAPSALRGFKRQVSEAKRRWNEARPEREKRENDVTRPQGEQIHREPRNTFNQMLDSVAEALSILGEIQKATGASDQQEIYSHIFAVTQVMKQIRHLFSKGWRKGWDECRDKINRIMDELNLVLPTDSIEDFRVTGEHCGQVLCYMKQNLGLIRSRALSTSENRQAVYGYERFDRRRDTMDCLQTARNIPQPQPPPVVPCNIENTHQTSMAEERWIPPQRPPPGWKDEWPPYVSPLEPFYAREAGMPLSQSKLIDKPYLHHAYTYGRREPPLILIEIICDKIIDEICQASTALASNPDADDEATMRLMTIEQHGGLMLDIVRDGLPIVDADYNRFPLRRMLDEIDFARSNNFQPIDEIVSKVYGSAVYMRRRIDIYKQEPERWEENDLLPNVLLKNIPPGSRIQYPPRPRYTQQQQETEMYRPASSPRQEAYQSQPSPLARVPWSRSSPQRWRPPPIQLPPDVVGPSYRILSDLNLGPQRAHPQLRSMNSYPPDVQHIPLPSPLSPYYTEYQYRPPTTVGLRRSPSPTNFYPESRPMSSFNYPSPKITSAKSLIRPKFKPLPPPRTSSTMMPRSRSEEEILSQSYSPYDSPSRSHDNVFSPSYSRTGIGMASRSMSHVDLSQVRRRVPTPPPHSRSASLDYLGSGSQPSSLSCLDPPGLHRPLMRAKSGEDVMSGLKQKWRRGQRFDSPPPGLARTPPPSRFSQFRFSPKPGEEQ